MAKKASGRAANLGQWLHPKKAGGAPQAAKAAPAAVGVSGAVTTKAKQARPATAKTVGPGGIGISK